MNTIEITHVLWSKHAIGVASKKIVVGMNKIFVTAKSEFDGSLYYPRPLVISGEEIVKRYKKEIINKQDLIGYFIPFDDFDEFYEPRSVEEKEL